MKRFTEYFPFWVLGASLLALYYPPLFIWFNGGFITLGLGIIMLGMGLTLTAEDFKRIFTLPLRVFLGVFLQYTIMPLSAYLVARFFGLPAEIAAGLILVGTCPGGTASNVIAYLARANVALSVTMTSVSTILSVFFTPLLSAWLIGNRVEVNITGLFLGTVQVVILPVVAGVVLNRYLHRFAIKVQPLAPPMAVIMIVMIVSSIIGSGRDHIMESGFTLFLAVILFHTGGFFWGYLLSKILLKDEIASRTISIEVGMQNSGLSVYLAMANFSSPLVAIPGAISSLVHSLIGSFLAGIWRKNLNTVVDKK